MEQLPQVSLQGVVKTLGDDVPHNSKDTGPPSISSTAQQQSSTGQSSHSIVGPLGTTGSLLTMGFCSSVLSHADIPIMNKIQIKIDRKSVFFI